MENLNTDSLMRLQVEQLEKEKKELNERMRIASKRLDHIERAYRKEERPLLAKDYEIQQANDKAAHEAAQKARIESARLSHQQDLETKKRLMRLMDDYTSYREVIISKRSEEFAKRREVSRAKIEEEKAKRKRAVLKQREEERIRHEQEEEAERLREEEERRMEEGQYSDLDFMILAAHAQDLQNVSQRRSVFVRRRKLRELQKRKRSAQRRRNWPRHGASARKSVSRHSNKLVCASSARTRPKSAGSCVRRSASARSWRQLLHVPAPSVVPAPLRPSRRMSGDVLELQPPPQRPPSVPLPLCPLRKTLPPSTALVPSLRLVAAGAHGQLPNRPKAPHRRRALSLLLLAPLRGRNQLPPPPKTASNPSKGTTSGALAAAGLKSCCTPHLRYRADLPCMYVCAMPCTHKHAMFPFQFLRQALSYTENMGTLQY